jgi:hypothetical protein
MAMSPARRYASLLLVSMGACVRPAARTTTTVTVSRLPIERSYHELGLGRWHADLWRDDSVHIRGIVDLEQEQYTLPMEQLLGRPLRAGARGAQTRVGVDVILGEWRDTLPNGGYTTGGHGGSIMLVGHWVGPDSLVGRWSEASYWSELTGSFLLVRCARSAPSNYCMQPTGPRTPSAFPDN